MKTRTGLWLIVTLVAAGCGRENPAPAVAEADAAPAVTIMAFNVQNLFDNVDDPDKDDKAYLPLAAKQNDAHREACAQIPVPSSRSRLLVRQQRRCRSVCYNVFTN